MSRVVLAADWRYLVVRSYAIDPAVIQPLVPLGLEIDRFDGKTYVSMIGLLVQRAKVFGWGIPLHRDFEEVRLRFYVRRRIADGWRRGVALVGRLVPRRTIAWAARAIGGEPCTAVPMAHYVAKSGARLHAEYRWRRDGHWESLGALACGEPELAAPGSREEFLLARGWCYAHRRGGYREHRIEHPAWRVWPAAESYLHADVLALYGEPFVEAMSDRPVSAFIVEGSPVTVRKAQVKEP